ncbi:hypothetical protein A6U98_11105 [Rhizobium sp. WYCCWR10014]|jgi:uncharacterized protein (UPF0548 family)|nr:hypothetical protein A6U98_11105 [Rhizobium sp. WYCCWR10014]
MNVIAIPGSLLTSASLASASTISGHAQENWERFNDACAFERALYVNILTYAEYAHWPDEAVLLLTQVQTVIVSLCKYIPTFWS